MNQQKKAVSVESLSTREAVEDFWRIRIEEAQIRYRQAADQYKKVLQGQLEGRPQDANGALAIAQQTASEAHAEYIRALRAFTQLILHGKMPEGRSNGGSNGL